MALPDKSTYAAYGGEIAYPAPEDPTADITSDASDEVRVDCAAMTRMIPRAYVTFTTDGTTCAVVEHDAVWGNDISIKPTVTVFDVGFYTVTWPSTVVDARGVSRAVNLRRGSATIEHTAAFCTALRQGPNAFLIVTNNSGSPALFVASPITLVVW